MVNMEGPPSTLAVTSVYEGEVYTLRIRFTDKYPIEAPEVIPAKHVGFSTLCLGCVC